MRLPEHLLDLADLRALEEQADRSTALRQLLHAGAEEYALELLRRGGISLSKAAELLDCRTLAVVEACRQRGMVGGAALEGYERAKAPSSES